ncbi:Uncharacterised protein family (UPF0175) [Armatimonadetes bacterium DC]|nr:Uncharacterised protein family (UPF0175) [Armatimonadetes bacterium DC]
MGTITVTVAIPQSVLVATGLQQQELEGFIREVIAVELYRQGRLSLGKAAEVAGVATRYEMTALLAKHGVFWNYTAADAEADFATIETFDSNEGG